MRVVVVDEAGKGARQARPHTDLVVCPTSCARVLLQTHQTPGPKTKRFNVFNAFLKSSRRRTGQVSLELNLQISQNDLVLKVIW